MEAEPLLPDLLLWDYIIKEENQTLYKISVDAEPLLPDPLWDATSGINIKGFSFSIILRYVVTNSRHVRFVRVFGKPHTLLSND